MLNPKPVSHINHYDLKDFFKYADKHMSLAQFSTTYLWRHSTGLLYDIQDDFLYLFEKKYNYSAPLPLGDGDIFKALESVKEYKEYVGGNNLVYCISEDKKSLFDGKYELSSEPDFAEYVYLSKDLIELQGKQFHAKKNHLNQFVKNNEYEYKRISSKDIPLVMDLLETWNQKKAYSSDLNIEKQAINELLNYDVGIDYKAGVIISDSRIVAFSIGEQISEDMACVYFEKADVSIKGSYAVINNEFVKNEFSHVKYINRQEDLGIEGLKRAKESYNPVFKVENYSMKL
ncbi:MAG: DUF2156 domain-containing protein [Clostridiaceae bacterium]|jgi:hypothetical protein|nr:DUF2156 domain-containing protein [Clostridiaceae bacterium]